MCKTTKENVTQDSAFETKILTALVYDQISIDHQLFISRFYSCSLPCEIMGVVTDVGASTGFSSFFFGL